MFFYLKNRTQNSNITTVIFIGFLLCYRDSSGHFTYLINARDSLIRWLYYYAHLTEVEIKPQVI